MKNPKEKRRRRWWKSRPWWGRLW